jgi:hypothetical protein
MGGVALCSYAALVIEFTWSPYLAPIVWIAAAAIILEVSSAANDTLLKRALCWQPLVQIGLISYSLYLWHYPVSLVLIYQMKMPVMTAAPLGITVSVALAALTYVAVESPCRRARDSIRPAIRRGLGRSAAAASMIGIAVGIYFFWSADLMNLVHPTPIKILAYGPETIQRGAAFNVQPDGASWLWLKASRTLPSDTSIRLAGTLLPTSVQGTVIAAAIPQELRDRVGKWTLTLVQSNGQPVGDPVIWEVK